MAVFLPITAGGISRRACRWVEPSSFCLPLPCWPCFWWERHGPLREDASCMVPCSVWEQSAFSHHFSCLAAGTLLQNVELPAFFQTATIVTPDGRRFAATAPLSRVQRYDTAGRFETGWFVDSGGGSLAIGLTTDGKIAVAAARTRRVEIFNADGSPAGAPMPFTKRDKSLMGDYLRPPRISRRGRHLRQAGASGQSGRPLEYAPAAASLESSYRLADDGRGNGRAGGARASKPKGADT